MGEETTGTWDTLKIHPTTLVRMVIGGEAEIIGNDKHGRHIYRLKQNTGGEHGGKKRPVGTRT